MAVATAKVPQVLSGTGIVPTAFTPAQVEGHYFPNNGGTVMIVFNGGATTLTVTAISQLTVEGLDVQDRATTIDAGVTKVLPPLNPQIFNDVDGNAYVTFSFTAAVTCSIISLGI